MSRLLVVVPPFTGHINPTVTLAAALERRGHRVAWAGPAAAAAGLLPAGCQLFDTNPEIDRDALSAMLAGGAGQRGLVAFRSLWEGVLIPLAASMLDGVTAAVDAFGPDGLIVDQQALAGAVVALRSGLPWVTSATTSAELADPLSAMPLVDRWVRTAMEQLQVQAGIDPAVASGVDLRCSPLLTLAYTTAEMVGDRLSWQAPVFFVGPAIADRVEDVEFPWEQLDPTRRKILVSLGSINAGAGERFFGVVAEALGRPDLQVIAVAPPELIPDPPPAMIVRARVPQLALLSRVDAVVTHAGHNTVVESLAHGLPMVLAPIRDDQPIVAGQVERAGAGIRVRFGRVGPAQLSDAVRAVLDDPRYRLAAGRIRASFAASGGASEAAVRIESALAGVPAGRVGAAAAPAAGGP